MVLLAAALYTVYQQRRKAQEEAAAAEQEHKDVKDVLQEYAQPLPPLVIPSSARLEWWRAVFGSETTLSGSSGGGSESSIGTGLAGIASYQLGSCTIQTTEKSVLGLGIVSLALGLCVASSSVDIPIGSVLVRVNGVCCLLAEPTRSALLRIWQWQGLVRTNNSSSDEVKMGPLCMEFIYEGQLFERMIYNRTDIQWAPCGQYGWVKRVEGPALQAGIARGSLLAAVNDVSVPTMAQAAHELQERPLRISWGMVPNAARGSPRQGNESKKKKTPRSTVTFHSLCASPALYDEPSALRQAAHQVAAGRQVRAVPCTVSRDELYPAVPPCVWPDDVVDEFRNVCRLRQAGYDGTRVHANDEDLNVATAQAFSLSLVAMMARGSEWTHRLLEWSQEDDRFGHSFYFLLRSFMSTLERQSSSSNLMALLHCLELLRHAEQELAAVVSPTIPETSPTVEVVQAPTKTKRFRFFKRRKQPVPVVATTESTESICPSPSTLYENMVDFLSQLDRICNAMERTLQKRHKLTEWALPPWNSHKETALAQVTRMLREMIAETLHETLSVGGPELTHVVGHECYVLPSAHFPLLLTFGIPGTDTETTTKVLCGDNDLALHGSMAGQQMQQAVDGCMEFASDAKVLSLRAAVGPSAIYYGWVNLNDDQESSEMTAQLWPVNDQVFDERGQALVTTPMSLRIQIVRQRRTVPAKRKLLYKHDEDIRQDAFAVQFIQTCGDILKACGLEMELLTFGCTPVGSRRGFIEWVNDSVPLSDICQPFSILHRPRSNEDSAFIDFADSADDSSSVSKAAKAGLTKYESLQRLPSIAPLNRTTGSMAHNPVQDYLRNVAYDAKAPYWIAKSVMDRYIKSCAGYSVITYILGVGDRHLDNLLMHPSGRFFHCDFSFILGQDPKTYLPMRITQDMIAGMGGNNSDNYAKFLSLTGAVFLTLRRPEYVRVLITMVRTMDGSWLPDVSANQTTEQAVLGVYERLKLNLTDEEALQYMEDLVESSVSSKMWMAVDAIHTLGKRIKY